jgi:hypothetical protein
MERGYSTRAALQFPVLSNKPVSVKRKRLALVLAGLADLVQLVFFPATSEGVLSPYNDAIDVAAAIAILVVLGFRWRLLLALALELVPFAAMFPSWTAVVATIPADATDRAGPAALHDRSP